MSLLIQFAAKLLLSGLLAVIAAACGLEIYRLWFDRTLVLADFEYVRDGQPAKESGQQFARLVQIDLARLAALYGLGRRTDEFALPSTDQIGRAETLDLPELRNSILDSVELKAYGVEFGAIFKILRRWIESPHEIGGSITERGKLVTVYAELKNAGTRPDQRTYWQVTDAVDASDASRGIACRIFRMLTRDSKRGSADAALFAEVTDEHFCLFNTALETYQRYRVRVAEVRPDEAKTALEDAGKRVTALVDANTKFPYAYKLAGFVLYEQGKLDAAQQAISRYLEWVTITKRTDKAAADLLAAMQAKRQPAAAAAAGPPSRGRLRPVQPGSSVSLTGAPTAGTICCVVRDSQGNDYLLSADHIFHGPASARVLQPGVADGGRDADAVAEYVRGTDNAGIARLLPSVVAKPEPLEIGVFRGTTSVVTPGQKLRTYGRSVGKIEGTVRQIDASLTIASGTGIDQKKRLEHVIITSNISGPGDSGAPVTTEDGKLIGMIYAGSQTTSVVIPIEPLLKALGVELVR